MHHDPQSYHRMHLATRRSNAAMVRGLYVIIDPEHTRGRNLITVAMAALDGGASAIQLRDKINNKSNILPFARQITQLCEERSAVCIINDHADLAVACGAHGLHIGQHDLPISEARHVLEPWQFVGTSNSRLEEALESYQRGADYIAVGAICPSSSKDNTHPAGLETLHFVHQSIPADGPPLVAIGGITVRNVSQVIRAGASSICVTAAVALADDPASAARTLIKHIQAALI